MRTRLDVGAAFAFAGALALIGCNRSAADRAESAHVHENHAESVHVHGHEDQAESEDGGARFIPGRGLSLATETAQALGLMTAPVEAASLISIMRLSVQVYRSGPPAFASAFVSTADAERFVDGELVGATVIRVAQEREPETATGQVELIVALTGGNPKIGDWVELVLTDRRDVALTIPRSALIEGADGPFVYLAEESWFLRTPVVTGIADANRISVVAGLMAGDRVAASSVDILFLTELRLTKGGGHSH